MMGAGEEDPFLPRARYQAVQSDCILPGYRRIPFRMQDQGGVSQAGPFSSHDPLQFCNASECRHEVLAQGGRNPTGRPPSPAEPCPYPGQAIKSADEAGLVTVDKERRSKQGEGTYAASMV